MTIETGIDLSTCVPGQKVKLRNGTIVQYKHSIPDDKLYEHDVNGYIYMNNGCYRIDQRNDELDVVEILPMESTSGIDLNTCVPGQKLRLRNGDIAEYNCATSVGNADTYTQSVDGYAYMNDGSYWKDRRESDLDVVEILPIEEEPAKPTPELTHSITDQIDVTNPDHVSIIPHEHGVTISIKKGLTTISWRHYNH